MQPYFLPSLSYFRLFAVADIFVFLDTVQFPRKGRVHRFEMPDANAEKRWVTLPLAKCPRETQIKDLQWHGNAEALWRLQAEGFGLPWTFAPVLDKPPLLTIVNTLIWTRNLILEWKPNAIFASLVPIAEGLTGQDRIIALCQAVGADEYVNLPGGKALYDGETFAKHGIKLKFLSEWQGVQYSIAHELKTKGLSQIRDELFSQVKLETP